VGTPDYLAPEILLGTGHGFEVDWWSLGVILFEFLTGKPPFNARSPQAIFENILNRKFAWPGPEEWEEGEAPSAAAIALVEALLVSDPGARLGAHGAWELKMHPFFDSVDWDALERQKTEAAFVPATDGDTDTSYFAPRPGPSDADAAAARGGRWEHSSAAAAALAGGGAGTGLVASLVEGMGTESGSGGGGTPVEEAGSRPAFSDDGGGGEDSSDDEDGSGGSSGSGRTSPSFAAGMSMDGSDNEGTPGRGGDAAGGVAKEETTPVGQGGVKASPAESSGWSLPASHLESFFANFSFRNLSQITQLNFDVFKNNQEAQSPHSPHLAAAGTPPPPPPPPAEGSPVESGGGFVHVGAPSPPSITSSPQPSP